MVKGENDKGLINGLRTDSHEAFQELFERYSQPLYCFALNYLKSKEDSEGIVQEVFIKIWKNRKKLKTDTSIKSYLFTIALNSIRKQFNKLSKLNEAKHEILIGFSQNMEGFDDKDDYQLLLNKLEEVVKHMPEKRRQVFIKKKLEEKSIKEIAKELSITPKTVEYHITESMKFLKKEFGNFQDKGFLFFHLFI